MVGPDGITVALALGPALITGMVGYLAARQQSEVLVRRTREETERLRLDHAEASRREREREYRSLLSLMYGLDLMMGGFAPMGSRTLGSWLSEFQAMSGGVELCGDAEVREALGEVRRVLDAIGKDAQSGSGEPFDRRFPAAYQLHRERLEEAVERLIYTMRADVALAPAGTHQHGLRGLISRTGRSS